jgi:hypothetical protein
MPIGPADTPREISTSSKADYEGERINTRESWRLLEEEDSSGCDVLSLPGRRNPRARLFTILRQIGKTFH